MRKPAPAPVQPQEIKKPKKKKKSPEKIKEEPVEIPEPPPKKVKFVEKVEIKKSIKFELLPCKMIKFEGIIFASRIRENLRLMLLIHFLSMLFEILMYNRKILLFFELIYMWVCYQAFMTLQDWCI